MLNLLPTKIVQSIRSNQENIEDQIKVLTSIIKISLS